MCVAELNLLTSMAGHSTRRPADAHDEHSALLIADADGEPDGTMRLIFGADGPFSAEFLDTYAMDAFFPVVAMQRWRSRLASPFATPTVGPRPIPSDRRGCTHRREPQQGARFRDCQPHPVALWGGLGFRPYRHTFNDPVWGLAIPMVMFRNEGDYSWQIGSPLLGAALDPDLPISEAARRTQSMLRYKPPVRLLKHLKKYDWPSEIAPTDHPVGRSFGPTALACHIPDMHATAVSSAHRSGEADQSLCGAEGEGVQVAPSSRR
jgi:hypothetical protein